jgi:hypothetical protein
MLLIPAGHPLNIPLDPAGADIGAPAPLPGRFSLERHSAAHLDPNGLIHGPQALAKPCRLAESSAPASSPPMTVIPCVQGNFDPCAALRNKLVRDAVYDASHSHLRSQEE